MKDNCFNEFDPNALNVEEALSRILKSIASKKTSRKQLKLASHEMADICVILANNS